MSDLKKVGTAAIYATIVFGGLCIFGLMLYWIIIPSTMFILNSQIVQNIIYNYIWPFIVAYWGALFGWFICFIVALCVVFEVEMHTGY